MKHRESVTIKTTKIIRAIALPIDCTSSPSPWREAIQGLTSPKLARVYDESQVGRLTWGYRLHILEFVIREKWDSKFRICAPLPKYGAKEFRLRGELCIAFLELLEAIAIFLPKSAHPAELFVGALLEDDLFFITPPDEQKAKSRRILQSQNQQLTKSINPFHSESWTCRFVDFAIAAASQMDRIEQRKYIPFVKARKTLTTYMIEHGEILSESEGAITKRTKGGRGRVKQRGVPEMPTVPGFQELLSSCNFR